MSVEEAPFEILEPLGAGGMADVYRAREVASGRLVALKLAREPDPDRLERFRREGWITASLNHPGIVVVHSAGVLKGRPYLAYELIERARPVVEAWKDFDLERRVQLLIETCHAVGHAHEQGIVHRDLKSENVLVDSDGRVRVADFGLASVVGLERLTRTGMLVGTPYCMAPEQVHGKQVQPATDVWALGVLLYQALTDRLPFPSVLSVTELMVHILHAKLVAPRRRNRSVPRALSDVCLRALRRPVQERYTDAGQLANALEQALATSVSAPDRRRWFLLLLVPLVVVIAAAIGLSWEVPAEETAEVEESPARVERPKPAGEDPLPTELEPRTVAEILPDPESGEPSHYIVLRREAVAEDPLAINKLAKAYRHGVGVTQDVEVALELYLISAGLGNTDAMIHVGELRFAKGPGPQVQAGIRMYERAATAGSHRGMTRLGRLYMDGLLVPRDDRLALSWFKKAADEGSPEGLYWLARAHWIGQGAKHDPVQAITLWKRAVNLGHKGAMCELGQRYERGEAVQRDLREAEGLYLRAAKRGFLDAMRYLARLLLPTRRAEAISWLRRAAPVFPPALLDLATVTSEGGSRVEIDELLALCRRTKPISPEALDAAARLIRSNRGSSVDSAATLIWLRAVAKSNDPASLLALGNALLRPGVGQTEQAEGARLIGRVSRTAKLPVGSYVVWGRVLEAGRGVARNVGEAAQWYRRAAQAGDLEGTRQLARLRAEGWSFEGDPDPSGPDPRAGWRWPQLPLKGLAPETLVQWYSHVSGRGVLHGKVALALSKLHGRGTQRDPAGAFTLLDQAAQAGHRRAMFWVSVMLWEGLGPAGVDFEQAGAWLREGAAAGELNSVLRMGELHLRGHPAAGFPRDRKVGLDWLRRAKRAGHPSAQRRLRKAGG